MKRRPDADKLLPSLRDKIIGLGERSIRKSYYPQLLQRLEELEKSRREIHEINQQLEHRVADRTAELEAANRELEAFAYSVSHDLRAPLRAVDGYSKILIEEYGGTLDAEGTRMLNALRENAKRMEQLIEDILNFSRAGRTGIAASETDMDKLTREVLEDLAPTAGKARIEIGSLPPAWGDRAMLRQVLVNLLSNAIKFSRGRESPSIGISGTLGENETIYAVSDNGAGFDSQYVDKLFGVFQRLHSEAQFEGTGIGLAIVKRIVNRHGGRVWAEGTVDGGATFHFSLPRGASVPKLDE